MKGVLGGQLASQLAQLPPKQQPIPGDLLSIQPVVIQSPYFTTRKTIWTLFHTAILSQAACEKQVLIENALRQH